MSNECHDASGCIPCILQTERLEGQGHDQGYTEDHHKMENLQFPQDGCHDRTASDGVAVRLENFVQPEERRGLQNVFSQRS